MLPTSRLFFGSTAFVLQFSSPANLQLLSNTMIYIAGFTAPNVLFQALWFGEKCGNGVRTMQETSVYSTFPHDYSDTSANEDNSFRNHIR